MRFDDQMHFLIITASDDVMFCRQGRLVFLEILAGHILGCYYERSAFCLAYYRVTFLPDDASCNKSRKGRIERFHTP
jgi:hypothetical protein